MRVLDIQSLTWTNYYNIPGQYKQNDENYISIEYGAVGLVGRYFVMGLGMVVGLGTSFRTPFPYVQVLDLETITLRYYPAGPTAPPHLAKGTYLQVTSIGKGPGMQGHFVIVIGGCIEEEVSTLTCATMNEDIWAFNMTDPMNATWIMLPSAGTPYDLEFLSATMVEDSYAARAGRVPLVPCVVWLAPPLPHTQYASPAPLFVLPSCLPLWRGQDEPFLPHRNGHRAACHRRASRSGTAAVPRLLTSRTLPQHPPHQLRAQHQGHRAASTLRRFAVTVDAWRCQLCLPHPLWYVGG